MLRLFFNLADFYFTAVYYGDVFSCLRQRAAVLFPKSAGKRGQTLIEYMLMMAVVAALVIIFGVLFHRRILGGFFTLVGLIIGQGLKVE